MLTLLFIICFFAVFGKLLMFGIKAAWGISKFLLTIVLLPVILIGLVVLFCLSLLVRDLSYPISVLLNEDAVVFINPYGRKFARLCYSEIRSIHYKTGEDMIISYKSIGIITVSRDFDDLSMLHAELVSRLHHILTSAD